MVYTLLDSISIVDHFKILGSHVFHRKWRFERAGFLLARSALFWTLRRIDAFILGGDTLLDSISIVDHFKILGSHVFHRK